jgi:hypothetical protein
MLPIRDGFDQKTPSVAWELPRLAESSDADAFAFAVSSRSAPWALVVAGQGTRAGYVPAAALTHHTTCFPDRARFAFDYRIDEGSLDASRDDLAEIGEITALDSKGVACGVLLHVQSGLLSAAVDGATVQLGHINASMWTRLEMVVAGRQLDLRRDGQSIATSVLGCEPAREKMVRVSVSGGRSINPGSYRAQFDEVVLESAQ